MPPPEEDPDAPFAPTVARGKSPLSEGSVQVTSELPHFRGAERFEPGERLGSGGMGEVVLQTDRNIGRAVAKKMLHPGVIDEVSVQRFLREARVQGQLEHPSVVPVHDFGVDAAGRLFFSMKRIRGETLAEITEGLLADDPKMEARFSRRRLLSAFVQVCLAVEYAHARGVIHRDLKPGNIMLGDFGEVYVLDWGLAKLSERPAADEPARASPKAATSPSPETTSDGDILGTPRYMAPEQLEGRHAVIDARADVFSLGVVLFEILARDPFRRGHVLSILVDVDKGTEPRRPTERGADVPAELDDLCAAALEPDPGKRLGSARALAEGVERYLEGARDRAARRAQAHALVESARARGLGPAADRDPVLATRDALKALALTPGDPEAERLIVGLMLESSRELGPEAERAYAAREAEDRVQGLRRGVVGFVLWLSALPFTWFVGVRAPWLLAALVGLTIACILVSVSMVRAHARTGARPRPWLLVVLTAAVVTLGSAYLGPFVLAPVAACAAATMFLIHATREEAPRIVGVWLAAIAVGFGVEWLHVVPPAYTFRDGGIVLHARMLGLPEGLTVAYLAYATLSFVAGLGYFVAQLRGKQRVAERQLFGQAWLLGRLFPGPAAPGVEEGGAAERSEPR